jgi:hypothetical protein
MPVCLHSNPNGPIAPGRSVRKIKKEDSLMAEKLWAQMTPEMRRADRIEKWRNPPIEFASPEAEADYKARTGRLVAAWDLTTPDRVPINVTVGFWPSAHKGMTPYDAMTDTQRAMDAWVDFNMEFQPDAIISPVMYTCPAEVYEALDFRLFSWPGHGSPEDAGFQYLEKEWMLPEEYDDLIADPTDYLLRTYLPRTVGAFSGFGNLSGLLDYIEFPNVLSNIGGWGTPEMLDGLKKTTEAAARAAAWGTLVSGAVSKLISLGFPAYFGGVSKAPFDILGDTLRGTKGIIMDMFRCPDKVLAACERLVPVAVNWALKRPGGVATPVVFMPLHKGADGFMSQEQYLKFWWPTFKEVVLRLIDQGLVVFLFAEGRFGSRLETIRELPRGKTVWHFDQTDMARAKEVLGDVACIQGNVPLSLLHAGTTEAVADYVRNLIDTAGKGGGFILDLGAVADSGNPENLHTMIRTAKEYGAY